MDLPLYMLDANGHPVECFNRGEWDAWMAEDTHRFLIRTPIGRTVIVSTVFLGHTDENGCLFETMILGGELDGLVKTALSRDEAQSLHDEMAARAKKAAK